MGDEDTAEKMRAWRLHSFCGAPRPGLAIEENQNALSTANEETKAESAAPSTLVVALRAPTTPSVGANQLSVGANQLSVGANQPSEGTLQPSVEAPLQPSVAATLQPSVGATQPTVTLNFNIFPHTDILALADLLKDMLRDVLGPTTGTALTPLTTASCPTAERPDSRQVTTTAPGSGRNDSSFLRPTFKVPRDSAANSAGRSNSQRSGTSRPFTSTLDARPLGPPSFNSQPLASLALDAQPGCSKDISQPLLISSDDSREAAPKDDAFLYSDDDLPPPSQKLNKNVAASTSISSDDDKKTSKQKVLSKMESFFNLAKQRASAKHSSRPPLVSDSSAGSGSSVLSTLSKVKRSIHQKGTKTQRSSSEEKLPSKKRRLERSNDSSGDVDDPNIGLCSICFTRRANMKLRCKHVYCHKCLKVLKAQKKPCPQCGQKFRVWEKLFI